jgi:hypothetical protein
VSAVTDRVAGFLEEIKKSPDIKMRVGGVSR